MYLSHHSKDPINTKYPSNVIMKPDVKEITKTGVNFFDGSIADLDIICYCTGYKYSFPFLHEDCKIVVDENHIQPLYKHMINIEYPTMCLIGIPFNVCAFQMFDLQVIILFILILYSPPSQILEYTIKNIEVTS